MNPSIPASDIVSVTPSVISAGGSALDMNGLCLTESAQVPIGTVAPFASAKGVADYFGASSWEAALATIYFNGFDNSNAKPGNMLFAQYPGSAVAAYLRGGAITLAQLKAVVAGVLTIISDGVSNTSSTITLSGATSPSDAASIIEAAFTTPTFAVSYDSVSGALVFTNTVTGATSTIDFAKSIDATATACTSSSTTLTVGGTVTGTFQQGDMIAGTDATNSLPTGCYIVKQLTGTTGGAGTYQMSAAATPGNLTSCAVTATGYTGTMAKALMLGSAQGAVTSQGANAAVPATFMAALTVLAQNWATFFTAFDPDGGSGNTVKLAFAAWAATTSDRYAYICVDTDSSPTTTVPATGSLGYLLAQAADSGTCLIYSPVDIGLGAFVAGAAASVDYTETNGAITFDFRSQSGLVAQVTDQTIAANLRANGYNFYGAWATANQGFIFFNPGYVSGEYQWLDAYLNQIWLNNALQLALMELLTNSKSVPYGTLGTTLIKAACADPINQANNFGMFQAGVQLSAAQVAEVNAAAGVAIDGVLTAQGWYLQVKPATAQVRAARQSPPLSLWYLYRESVQTINLASIELQ